MTAATIAEIIAAGGDTNSGLNSAAEDLRIAGSYGSAGCVVQRVDDLVARIFVVDGFVNDRFRPDPGENEAENAGDETGEGSAAYDTEFHGPDRLSGRGNRGSGASRAPIRG